jgi:hypothetical protein
MVEPFPDDKPKPFRSNPVEPAPSAAALAHNWRAARALQTVINGRYGALNRRLRRPALVLPLRTRRRETVIVVARFNLGAQPGR